MVIDGCTMFNCHHEFVALPFGFVCHKCGHEREELELVGRKALLFFPSITTVATAQIIPVDAAQA